MSKIFHCYDKMATEILIIKAWIEIFILSFTIKKGRLTLSAGII